MDKRKDQDRERDGGRRKLCAEIANLFSGDGIAKCGTKVGGDTTVTVTGHLTVQEFAALATASERNCSLAEHRFTVICEPIPAGEATYLDHDDFVQVSLTGFIDPACYLAVMDVLAGDEESQISDMASALAFALAWMGTRPGAVDSLDAAIKAWYTRSHLHRAEEK